MAQTFMYPNLLSGTRTGRGWTRDNATGGNGFDYGTGLTLATLNAPDGVLRCTIIKMINDDT